MFICWKILQFSDVVVISGCGPLGIGAVAAAVQKNPARVVALDVLDWKVREEAVKYVLNNKKC